MSGWYCKPCDEDHEDRETYEAHKVKEPWQGYQGRRWDAPMTDDMPVLDLTGQECCCGELIAEGDDAVRLGSTFHIECLIRSTLGSVDHLQGKCTCFGGHERLDDEGTYREQARQTLEWMLQHGRGRWASE